MTAQELRIGNCVQEKETGAIGTVSLPSTGGELYQWIDQYEPIPITQDWLERMGFERNVIDGGTPLEVVYHTLRLSNEVYCNLTLMSGDKNGYPEVCLFPYESFFRYRYVHEVQNLYYAILGKELTISEPCP